MDEKKINFDPSKYSKSSNNKKNKVMLIIRDGYGKRDERPNNAVALANTSFTDYLMKSYPTTLLKTSGTNVGLPDNYMGGSEVGHLTIGSGRIIWQQLEMINRAIENGSFFKNEQFLSAIRYAKENDKAIQIIGLLQNKGVHAHQEHLFALLKLCKQEKISKEKVIIHIFSDGRDSPPKSVEEYVEELQKNINELEIGVIGTIIGRYYAMDRDTRWDRTKLAYDMLVHAKGEKFNSINDAIHSAYEKEHTDEFIPPSTIGNFAGIYEGDVIINYNYRTDRVRQLTQALCEESFKEFKRDTSKKFKHVVMTNYYDNVCAKIAFDTQIPKNGLGEVIADNGLTQLRISETEKYPHITFFFNGQRNEPFKNEERILIPSPRDVATYDEKPEMSIYEIKDKLLVEMEKEYDLIVVNYVNGDMVGHTGHLNAAIQAVEAVEECVEDTIERALQLGYDTLIFADHGNCEEMAGEHQTSHTLNDVDCILVSNKDELQKDNILFKYGGLKDIAPTALELLGVEKPQEMNGESLIRRKKQLTHDIVNIFKRK